MENEQEIESVTCKNCGCGYTLNKGAPELCWICGLPTNEKIENEN
jgi:hypothetical protein